MSAWQRWSTLLEKLVCLALTLKGKRHSGSDVDLQVEFVTKSVSMLTLNALKYRLEEILGIDVDVIHESLSEDSMIVLGKVVPVYES